MLIGNSLSNFDYWLSACQFFTSIKGYHSAGSYFIHNKNRDLVTIGIMPTKVVSVEHARLVVTLDGDSTVEELSNSEDIFTMVERHLCAISPTFFLVSPDIKRKSIDESLPQFLAVQPGLEFVFSPKNNGGRVSYARDAEYMHQASVMLKRFSTSAPEVKTGEQQQRLPFDEVATEWSSPENDESFLQRLNEAIRVLQEFPEGKIVPTRAYEYKIKERRDPFRLYEQQSRLNGEYAFSHFCCIRDGVYSIGSTPENVFEIDKTLLSVDVVAGTCKPSEDETFVARELSNNSKQILEHTSSLRNRLNKFKPFCRDRSFNVIKNMDVKKLRNVFHLHSRFSAEILENVTPFGIMANILPMIGARPKELLQIADPELVPHRFYGGLVGHLHLGVGGCFLNIRNALLDGESLHAKVGTGVIRESDAYNELVETRDKISGLMEAVRLWEFPTQAQDVLFEAPLPIQRK